MAGLLTPDPAAQGNQNANGENQPSNQADWKSALPDDIRGEKAFESFKDLGTLGKSYLEMVKYQGRSVAIPGDDAKPEDVDKFHRKLGRPDSADKYTFEEPKDLPKGVAVDAELMKEFKEDAFKLGLNNKQFNSLAQRYFKSVSKMLTPAVISIEDGEKALKKEWGDAYDNNVGLAQNAAKKLMDPEAFTLFEKSGLANHPAIVKMFTRIAQKYMSEDQFVSGNSVATQESAQEKIQAILQNKEHPYHKGDRDAVQAMAKLYALAYPEPA